MMPTELNGDRLPALAPLATISAVRNGDIPARAPTAIAIGTTSATLATAPGPTVESPQAMRKNIHGSSATRPRARPSAAIATRCSVPFTSASVNSSVTPASVRNSCAGNPAVTSSTRPA